MPYVVCAHVGAVDGNRQDPENPRTFLWPELAKSAAQSTAWRAAVEAEKLCATKSASWGPATGIKPAKTKTS